MDVKTSGRLGLSVATALFAFVAGPSLAATDAGGTEVGTRAVSAGSPSSHQRHLRHGLHHHRSYAHHRSRNPALRASAGEQIAMAGDGNEVLPQIPPSVANANAQLQFSSAPGAETMPSPARSGDLAQGPANATAANGTVVAAADQLNDADRALREDAAPAASLTTPPANQLPPRTNAASHESSTWDQTSLIGKIFIGFGALLTMASAARMFMA
jgi:hypothetical protein